MMMQILPSKSGTPSTAFSPKLIAVTAAMAVFVCWMLATYLFEGRIQLMHHPTPAGRAIYVLIANAVIGIAAAFWIIRKFLGPDSTAVRQSGFRTPLRTVIGIAAAVVAGGGLFLIQGPPSHHPLVLFNGFVMVLPVSIAEIVVCWALIGRTVETWAGGRNKVLGIIAGIAAADILFGIYHFAHSAPFNQLWMVAFLLAPGLVTSLVYFLGRDLYATILFHNFLGMTGVLQNANLMALNRPLYHHYLILAASLVVLILADQLLIRRK